MNRMNLGAPAAMTALGIARKLKEAGHLAYFAGGCVRDFLMSRDPQDFDIATTAMPEDVEELFQKTVPVGKQFGVILVVEEGKNYEVATFRREGGYSDGRHPSVVEFTEPKEDALRRDFTVNGLFYDPFGDKVIDYVNGAADINKKIIRAIGDPDLRFDEDKLRLLRAVRFASALNFKIESGTWDAVKKRAMEISSISAERIRDELVKIFTKPNAHIGLDLLSAAGLLKQILPEVEAMKGVEQPPEFHPEGDVYVHTRLLLEKLDQPTTATLALGALFHDVGKPPTLVVREGKITFYEHAQIGAKMTETIMRRLRFSNEEIDSVCSSVENHMKFGDVQKMREGKLKRFVSRNNFSEELELHRIDCLSCHGKLDNYQFLKNRLKDYAAEDLKPDPLINGHDLLALGMKPGPGIKRILEELYDLQLESPDKDRNQMLELAREKVRIYPNGNLG